MRARAGGPEALEVPTVDRVRPWRRHPAADHPPPPRGVVPPGLVDTVVGAFRKRHPDGVASRIVSAYRVAEVVHRDQLRFSGDPYISHPVAVASVVADLGLDDISVAAALLHDAVEDTGLTLEEIDKEFGPEVASIVDGVTKLDRLQFDSKEAQQAATVRKMLVAMAKDWRVLVIKLADRLHNMRTIAALPEWKQRRTAQETLDIYAPLAHRLGIQEVKWQLEDLAFATLYPRRYAEIEQMVAGRAPERDNYIDSLVDVVRRHLARVGIEAEVTGRPKHLWSIYEKMVVRGREFDEIYDLVGMRVIAPSENDCWAALGCIHAAWSPVPGRFKDYINTPKFNLYQSLHTTVVGPEGKPLEVQIRTREMHLRAEFGIAAHWGYKEKASPSDVAWVSSIVDWQADTPDPMEFLESLKLDLVPDEVYVFTPKGKVITLAAGATPIDFAYAIHTEVGHRCIGARVGGRLSPLDTVLQSGDTVEIFTSRSPQAGPSRDWLQIVVTPRARNKIRQWFSRERREDAKENGREELAKALRREGLPVSRLSGSSNIGSSGPGGSGGQGGSGTLATLAASMNYADLDALYAAVGDGHVSARSVAQRLARELRGGDHEEALPTTVAPGRRAGRRRTPGVYVEGLDDVMIRLSRCCTPVPGDDIIGFVTVGRGVSVHRADCGNAISLAASTGERLIEVEWDQDRSGTFAASLEVIALDRTKLLADVSRTVSEHHLNIVSCSTHTSADRVSRMRFEIELADPGHLDSVIASVRGLEGVYEAYRVVPGRRT